MPRIYTSSSEPVDYCRRCFPKTEAAAFARHGHDGDDPGGRGNCFAYDAYRPGYDGEDYTCATCGRTLTEGNA